MDSNTNNLIVTILIGLLLALLIHYLACPEPKITQFNNKGGNLIKNAFNFLKVNPKFLTDSFLRLLSQNLYSPNQIIGFYIAGMTDQYIIKFCKHNNLVSQEEINIFTI